MDSTLFFIIVVAVVIIGVIFTLVAKTLGAKASLQQGAQQFQDRMFLKARKHFDQLLISDNTNALVYWYSARTSSELGEIQRAISELNTALKLGSFTQPTKPLPSLGEFSEAGVQKQLRSLYSSLRFPKKVHEIDKLLLYLEPENPIHPLNIAKFFFSNNEFTLQVENFLNKTIEIDPSHSEAYFLKSYLQLRTSESDNAEKNATKALEINPKMQDAAYVLGRLKYEAKQFSTATELLNKAKFGKYFAKSSAYILAKIAASQNDFTGAEKYIEQAEEKKQSSLEAKEINWLVRYFHGNLLEKLKKNREALKIYKSIYSRRPDFKDVATKVASLEQDKEHQDDHVKDFLTAKNDVFLNICEKVITALDLKVSQIEVAQDGSLVALAKKPDISPKPMGIFVKRNQNLIGIEILQNMKKFYDSSKGRGGIVISSGFFTNEAKELSKKMKIQLIDGSELEKMLEKLMTK